MIINNTFKRKLYKNNCLLSIRDKTSKCVYSRLNDYKIRLIRIKWPIVGEIIFEASFLNTLRSKQGWGN